MKKSLYLALIILTLATCSKTSPEPTTIEMEGLGKLYHWETPHGLAITAPQPNLKAISALKDLKIKTVINLRGPDEFLPGEEAAVKAAGMTYVSIPVVPSILDVDTVQHFGSHYTNSDNYPLFVHCTSGNRAAMMMALGQIFGDNISVETAMENAEQRGLTKAFLKDTIYTLVKEEQSKH